MVDRIVKLENFFEQVKKIIKYCDIEKDNSYSKWELSQLDYVQSEMRELLNNSTKDNVYFRFGKKQRMLESTYFITDSLCNLGATDLGKEIIILQEIYDKI